MDQGLKDHKLFKLNQDEIDNLKSSITIKEIKVIFFKSSWERNFHIQMENSTKHLIPGGLMVKTPCFHCRGAGSIPGRETKIPRAARRSQKK